MADTEDNETTAAPKGTAARKTAARTTPPAAAEKPAKIGAAGPDSISGSGAILEPDAASAVDVDHPAVDNNPRAGTTAGQNAIQFNDPTKTDEEAVRERLG